MTVIAAWADSRGVWMAADGNSTVDEGIISSTTRKISRKPPTLAHRGRPGGDLLFALTGSWAAARVFDSVHLEAMPDPDDEDDRNGWAHAVCKAIVGAIRDLDLDPSRNAWLIGWAGHLWYCDGNPYAMPVSGEFMTLGSGGDVAMGALDALAPDVRLDDLYPTAAVRRAVESAVRWKAYLGGTIQVEHAAFEAAHG